MENYGRPGMQTSGGGADNLYGSTGSSEVGKISLENYGGFGLPPKIVDSNSGVPQQVNNEDKK